MAENMNIGEMDFEHPEYQLHTYRYCKAKEFVYGSILDVACSYGYGSYILSEKGEVKGYDRDVKAIAYAREHYPECAFIEADIEEIILPDVDCIVSIETVEHLKDPVAFVKKIKQHAKRIIISTPIIPTKHLNEFHLHDFTSNEVDAWFDGWTKIHDETQDGVYKIAVYQHD